MATAPAKLMTAEEFWEFCSRYVNDDRRFELERGEVVEMPLPGKVHGFICGNVAGTLRNHAIARKRGYVCTNDSGLIVERGPDTVRGPDVCYYDDGQTADTMDQGLSTTLPRLVAEVMSPSDTFPRTLRKAEQYLKAGVPLVWIVDPETRTVTQSRIGEFAKVFDEMDELTGEDVLPDFRCKVADLFTLPGTK